MEDVIVFDYLLNEFPNDIDLEPIQWIHALGLDGDIPYFVEEE